jgi:V-type H+-transporting ATPase subunit a
LTSIRVARFARPSRARAMELFRSERMSLARVIVPEEAARDTIERVGELGVMQFQDLNSDTPAFKRAYSTQIRRADELLRRLRYFRDEARRATIAVARSRRRNATGRGSGATTTTDELDHVTEELERDLAQALKNYERLMRTHSELMELQLVLEKAGGIFEESRADGGGRGGGDVDFRGTRSYDDVEGGGESLLPVASVGMGAATERRGEMGSRSGSYLEMAELDAAGSSGRGGDGASASSNSAAGASAVRLGFITGVILTNKVISFERILFRATRGNMFLKQSQILGTVVDPTTGEKCEKTVCVVFFAGERAREKIIKICEAFNVNRYPFPEDYTRQRQMYAECTARLVELQSTLDASTQHRDDVLRKVGDSLEDWIQIVLREKAIYHTMSMCSVDVTRKVLVAQAWIPDYALSSVQTALTDANHSSLASVGTIFQQIETKESPPTHFQTNKVTSVFQGIVDAYGVASYREVNPTVFTIVTFPFLFAVMFGDFGHGFLMLFAALYLVMNEKKLAASGLNEIIQMAFDGRYAILLMSIFSIYTGLLYNECFSVPMNWFGASKYVCDPNDPTASTTCDSAYKTGLVNNGDGAYAFGVDPIWHGSRSELPFLNSLKMKMSILMGVTQMMLGIFMSFLNQVYTNDKLSMYCEFFPQVIFLGALFGYLSLLIVIKWCTPGSTADLYHVMIYMFLSPGNVDCAGEGENGGPGCPENVLFPGQAGFQNFLLFLAFVAVPVMLFPKPYILKKRHEASRGGVRRGGVRYARLDAEDDDDEAFLQASDAENSSPSAEEEEEFDFGEIMVHQGIHTIEFVLGAVSNTASYLRLWALSLAHAQLSAVFWDRVFMGAVASGNVVAIVMGFAVWAFATIGVLMLMESLSAFLHALRLHWVEFNNKFFKGAGYAFVPFTFVGLSDKSDDA